MSEAALALDTPCYTTFQDGETVRGLLSRERIGLERNGGPHGGLPARARWLLAQRVGRVLSDGEGVADATERVVRLAVPVGPVAPLRWLREQSLPPKLYWSGRGDRGGVAAAGVADLHEADAPEGVGSLRKRLAPLLSAGAARYYGGLRFDPLREPDPRWAPFGAYRFVLPRFELHAGEEEATLVCNLVLPRDTQRRAEILQEVERLSFPRAASRDALPEPVSRADHPDSEGWRRNVELALSAFSEGRLDKVVLARRTELHLWRSWTPPCSPSGWRRRRPVASTSTSSPRRG